MHRQMKSELLETVSRLKMQALLQSCAQENHSWNLTSESWKLLNKLKFGKSYYNSLKSNEKVCPDPGSNRGPLDLQSNALPTELSRLPQTMAQLCVSIF